ncbi:MAG: tRNA (adenosine(37)-N6)-threonylcarbamoyltransferase complex ATPase subunit type 1 TsaE [Spirochaetes bacterium]|nr:MAG: tRNA (adenosine(37)-N6)-threonylcarbamoyltransferase complex ATPase subunit type 1 TsaE [Spirochaetota bacterium]
MHSTKLFTSNSSEDTISLGERVGKKLFPGAIVSLKGVLGSGKTVFTKGIARGLKIKEEVLSPSFTLINEYEGKLKLYHLDMYRIDSEEEFKFLGVDDILYGNGVSVIEWGDKIEKALPEDHISVLIEIKGDTSRILQIDGIEL